MIYTAPLAKNYVAGQNLYEIPKPFKRYQLGTVWRNEKPGPGRFRNKYFDADCNWHKSKNAQADEAISVLDI